MVVVGKTCFGERMVLGCLVMEMYEETGTWV